MHKVVATVITCFAIEFGLPEEFYVQVIHLFSLGKPEQLCQPWNPFAFIVAVWHVPHLSFI